jgi:outer membrane protein TolC
MNLRALPLLLALVGAGCSTAPDVARPEDLPASTEPSIAAETTAATALRTPRRLIIDLPSALELAGARDPELRLARVAVEQTKNRTLARELSFLPTVYPIFRAFSHQGQAQTQSARNVNVTRTNYEVQVLPAFQWDPGPVMFNILAASRREDAARAHAETKRLDALLAAATGYLDLVRSYSEVAIAQGAVGDATELLRFAESRVRAGAAVKIEVLRARAELARRDRDLAEAVGHVAQASANLVSLLLLDSDVELVPKEEFPELLSIFPSDASILELIARGEADRPEVAEARAELAAREREREGSLYGPFVPFLAAPVPARAAYPPLFPTLLKGAYDVPSTTRSSNLPTFGQWGPGLPAPYGQFYGPDSPFGDTGRTGFFGPTLGALAFSQDFMVYTGVHLGPGGIGDIPEYQRTALALQEGHIHLDRIQRDIQREVSEIQADLVSAHDRLEAAREGVTAGRESFRLERDSFEKGAAIQLDVFDAQEVLVAAENHELEAIVDYDAAQYRLLRALGASGR